jgi:hypothetical protein
VWNLLLQKILRPKREAVTGDWIKMHNEEINDLCSSPSIFISDQFKDYEIGREWVLFLWGRLKERDYLKT